MNKTVDYYMSLPYCMEIVPDMEEGGYTVAFPELPGCISCADTLEELIINAQDAKRVWLTAAIEDGVEIREPRSREKRASEACAVCADRKASDLKITDFNQENRNLLEQGINLLRYGLKEDEIDEFIEACISDTAMAKFINHNMNTWGPGFEYE